MKHECQQPQYPEILQSEATDLIRLLSLQEKAEQLLESDVSVGEKRARLEGISCELTVLRLRRAIRRQQRNRSPNPQKGQESITQ